MIFNTIFYRLLCNLTQKVESLMSIMFKSKGLASSQTTENSSKHQLMPKPFYYLAVEDKPVASTIFNAYEIDTIKTLHVQNSEAKKYELKLGWPIHPAGAQIVMEWVRQCFEGIKIPQRKVYIRTLNQSGVEIDVVAINNCYVESATITDDYDHTEQTEVRITLSGN